MKTEFTAIRDGGLWGGRLLLFESLPSTNRWAMENLAVCRTGDVITATTQTAGRGRFDRAWVVPENRGLALSLILRKPQIEPGLFPTTGAVSAIAVYETLAACGIDAMLKWPNDVMADGKKICGILAELDSASETVVLGIGLNVNVTRRDLRAAGLQDTATSMRICRGHEYAAGEVRARLIAYLEEAFQQAAQDGAAWVAGEWARHDWLTGYSIEILTPQGTVRGTYAGTDSTGALCMIDSAGARRVFTAGDVVRLRPTT